MLVKSLQFALLTFGLTSLVAFLVAVMIKVIAVVIRRRQQGAADNNAQK